MINTKKLTSKNGFSLIELLIVMVIIGVLAAIAIPSILTAQMDSRDTARLQYVKNIQAEVTKYFTANNVAPYICSNSATGVSDCNAYLRNDSDGSKEIVLSASGKNKVLIPESSNGGYTFKDAGTGGCSTNKSSGTIIYISYNEAGSDVVFCKESGSSITLPFKG